MIPRGEHTLALFQAVARRYIDGCSCDDVVSAAVPGSGQASERLALVAKLFRGFADPSRLESLEPLREGERGVSDPVTAMGLARSNVADHLSGLKDCGPVTSQQRDRYVFDALADPTAVRMLTAATGYLIASPGRSPPAPAMRLRLKRRAMWESRHACQWRRRRSRRASPVWTVPVVSATLSWRSWAHHPGLIVPGFPLRAAMVSQAGSHVTRQSAAARRRSSPRP